MRSAEGRYQTRLPEVQAVLEHLHTEYVKAEAQFRAVSDGCGWYLCVPEAVTQLKQLMNTHPRSVVLSREDVVPGFWDNSRAPEFLAHLKSHPLIAQKRVRVFVGDSDDILPDRVVECHTEYAEILKSRRGALFSVPDFLLTEHRLSKLAASKIWPHRLSE